LEILELFHTKIVKSLFDLLTVYWNGDLAQIIFVKPGPGLTTGDGELT